MEHMKMLKILVAMFIIGLMMVAGTMVIFYGYQYKASGAYNIDQAQSELKASVGISDMSAVMQNINESEAIVSQFSGNPSWFYPMPTTSFSFLEKQIQGTYVLASQLYNLQLKMGSLYNASLLTLTTYIKLNGSLNMDIHLLSNIEYWMINSPQYATLAIISASLTIGSLVALIGWGFVSNDYGVDYTEFKKWHLIVYTVPYAVFGLAFLAGVLSM